jgi:hypothetical protein
MERVLAAKSSIHASQALVLVATMVLCAAMIVAPTYIMGAIVGEQMSADGLLWITFYYMWLLVAPAKAWLRIGANETFGPALKGTKYEMSLRLKIVFVCVSTEVRPTLLLRIAMQNTADCVDVDVHCNVLSHSGWLPAKWEFVLESAATSFGFPTTSISAFPSENCTGMCLSSATSWSKSITF